MRISPDEYRALDLEVHALLCDVPLQDVSVVDLPGGGPNRSILELQPLFASEEMRSSSGIVRVLFGLRELIGRLFGWDSEETAYAKESYISRLSEDQRARSEVPPGTSEAGFRVLYAFPAEALAEIRNVTVHAFSCMVLRPVAGGYRFYWAIYVKPVSWLTPAYMAAIEPFRRYIVYPTILARLKKRWIEEFGAA